MGHTAPFLRYTQRVHPALHVAWSPGIGPLGRKTCVQISRAETGDCWWLEHAKLSLALLLGTTLSKDSGKVEVSICYQSAFHHWDQCLRKTTLRRKDRFWFMVLEVSVCCWLLHCFQACSKAEWKSGRVWHKKGNKPERKGRDQIQSPSLQPQDPSL